MTASSVVLNELKPEAPTRPEEIGPGRWHEVRGCVAMLLEEACGVPVTVEKRASRRYPFRKPLMITPVQNATGKLDRTKSFSAFGIDVSSSGICFLSRQLVSTRKAVVTCDATGDRQVSLLFEARWVRFTRGGWYQTGGRLLNVLPDDHVPTATLTFSEPPPELDEF